MRQADPARAAPGMNGERTPQAAANGEPAAPPVPRRQRWAITAPAAAAAAVSWVALDRVAPFRFGLLSVALYAAPAAVAVTAVRRARTIPVTRDRRRTLGQALAIMTGLLVLAWTVGGHADRAHTDHDLADWVDDVWQLRSNPRRG